MITYAIYKIKSAERRDHSYVTTITL